jgi:hypothetical protein
MQLNNRLIEVLLTLGLVEEGGLYGGTYADRETVERCRRILDALVPPPKEENSESSDGGNPK